MRTTTPPALRCSLLMFASACAIATCAKDRDEIKIRGRLLLDGVAHTDAILVVEVNDMDCVPFDLDADGRFSFNIPIDGQARIRFEKPGYLSKEVTVDTRNALLTEKAEKLNKRVDFDVLLQPLPSKEMAYAGPVGKITFTKGTGLMKVRTDRTLTRTPEQVATMPSEAE
jgi:hypothetical protein